VRGLGQGNFTTVLEVQHRRTQEVFALKVIEKEQVRSRGSCGAGKRLE
jgi:serine/threonine protein kinase